MMESALAGLEALPCPAIYIGEELWLNDEMKKLVSTKEAEEIFSEDAEPGRGIMLAGRSFAVMRSEKDEHLVILAEQLPPEENQEKEALEMRLRNALACAMLAAQLLSREVKADKGKSYLAEIKKNMAQIERACDNLRTAHLQEMDGTRLTDIKSLVKELFDRANYYLPEEKQINCRIEDGGTDIYCAPALIENLLLNLTAELLARGGRESRVSLTVAPGDHFTFTIRAAHLGSFRDELEAMLFEAAGAGTGFESARRIVALHHGSMYVRKQDADGAVITVALPYSSEICQVYNAEERYRGYDYVRMMLSDILQRDAFME